MSRISVWRFGIATAFTLSLLSAICAVAFAIDAERTLAFFNLWIHGLDLTALIPQGGRRVGAGQAAYGVVAIGAVGLVGGLVFATAYNVFRTGSE